MRLRRMPEPTRKAPLPVLRALRPPTLLSAGNSPPAVPTGTSVCPAIKSASPCSPSVACFIRRPNYQQPKQKSFATFAPSPASFAVKRVSLNRKGRWRRREGRKVISVHHTLLQRLYSLILVRSVL